MEVNPYVVALLANKIKNGEVNPKTNKPFTIEDIVAIEYKYAILIALNEKQ